MGDSVCQELTSVCNVIRASHADGSCPPHLANYACNCASGQAGQFCNVSATNGTFVAQGRCYHMHVSEIRGLGTTYLNAVGAFCLFISFLYVLRESNRNMRLAIAGEDISLGIDDRGDYSQRLGQWQHKHWIGYQ